MFGVVSSGPLNLRSGPGTNYGSKGLLAVGTRFEVIVQREDGWIEVRVLITNDTGFISQRYITLDEDVPPPQPPRGGFSVRVETRVLNIRKTPNTNWPTIGALREGDVVEVLDVVGEWYKIDYNGPDAYIFADFTRRLPEGTEAPPLFLSHDEDLRNFDPLEPEKAIPTGSLNAKQRVVARIWNDYGGFLSLLAQKLVLPVEMVMAVMAVESGGRGFDDNGRMIIRFEVHVFDDEWGQDNRARFNAHFSYQGISNHRWRPDPPGGEWRPVHVNSSDSQNYEWAAFEFARLLSVEAAMRSISMGAGQIMGFNYRHLGYVSAEDMFAALSRSIEAQILGTFDYIRRRGAIQALQTGDFLQFARDYNGYSAHAEEYARRMMDYCQTFIALRAQWLEDAPTGEDPTPLPPVLECQPPLTITIRENLNLRDQPTTNDSTVIGTIAPGELVRPLEPYEEAVEKIARASAREQEWLHVQKLDGLSGYAAAWLMTPADGLLPECVDDYLNELPPRTDIPAIYRQFWAHQEHLGLPSPFPVLPFQVKSRAILTNMQVNGFGPNTFAMKHGARWYDFGGQIHNGYDFIIAQETPLVAVSDGLIVNWPFMGDCERSTEIALWCFLPEDRRDGAAKRMMSNVLIGYGHVHRKLVRTGDVVSRGETIGLSGSPRNRNCNQVISNAHLHLEAHLLEGDPQLFDNATRQERQLLREYIGRQPLDNNTPWNPLMFFDERIVTYCMHQGETIGYPYPLGTPEYPDAVALQRERITNWVNLTPFSVAYYRYGRYNAWRDSLQSWERLVVLDHEAIPRLTTFARFDPTLARVTLT
ncbi:MAG: hypothetical protein OHK0046_41720 [Anaerolineae bacterium]